MAYDYSKLRGRIIEKFGSQAKFAEAMQWSERTTSLKLNCEVYWKQPEISKAIRLLAIPENQIQLYFFTLNVQL